MSQQNDTGGMVPSPGKNATLEELEAAMRSIEASDAPGFLKDQVRMDLAERIRDYSKERKLEPMGYGRSFAGASVEQVVKSGFSGRLPDEDGNMVKVKP